jgi:Ca-activated chloride channel family protein
LSAAGRGSTEYVEPGEDVERVVSLLAGKITQPVLTDLLVGDSPVDLVELFPRELPDLFAGEELVLFGRYRGSGSGSVEIRGRRGGATETFAADIEFDDRTANDFIPRLWASRKLGELTRQVRLHGPDEELIEAIRSTALRYGLLSEYTAYLVREPLEEAGLQRVEDRMMAYAPEPAAATGAAAVKASERARAQRSVASAADLDMAEAEVMNVVSGEGLRTVAGRVFRLEDEVWTELGGARTDARVREIALYSPAFFDVLEALPELGAVVEELQPVVVKGREVAIRFGDDGDTALSGRELRDLVERFRAR